MLFKQSYGPHVCGSVCAVDNEQLVFALSGRSGVKRNLKVPNAFFHSTLRYHPGVGINWIWQFSPH